MRDLVLHLAALAIVLVSMTVWAFLMWVAQKLLGW